MRAHCSPAAVASYQHRRHAKTSLCLKIGACKAPQSNKTALAVYIYGVSHVTCANFKNERRVRSKPNQTRTTRTGPQQPGPPSAFPTTRSPTKFNYPTFSLLAEDPKYDSQICRAPSETTGRVDSCAIRSSHVVLFFRVAKKAREM